MDRTSRYADANSRHDPAHYPRRGKLGQSQRNKETGEPDDATSIKSGSEGAGRKGRKDLARSLPSFKVLGVLFSGKFSQLFYPQKGMDTQISALLSSPTVTHEPGSPPRIKIAGLFPAEYPTGFCRGCLSTTSPCSFLSLSYRRSEDTLGLRPLTAPSAPPTHSASDNAPSPVHASPRGGARPCAADGLLGIDTARAADHRGSARTAPKTCPTPPALPGPHGDGGYSAPAPRSGALAEVGKQPLFSIRFVGPVAAVVSRGAARWTMPDLAPRATGQGIHTEG